MDKLATIVTAALGASATNGLLVSSDGEAHIDAFLILKGGSGKFRNLQDTIDTPSRHGTLVQPNGRDLRLPYGVEIPSYVLKGHEVVSVETGPSDAVTVGVVYVGDAHQFAEKFERAGASVYKL